MNRVTDRGIWIESDVPLAKTAQWSIPVLLVRAVAAGYYAPQEPRDARIEVLSPRRVSFEDGG
jgi:hypothetical protein